MKSKIKYLIFLLMMVNVNLWAINVSDKPVMTVESANYTEAKEKADFLHFKMKSTKAGIITTVFDGYVNRFEVFYQWDKKNQTFTNSTILFQTMDLDTDVNGRNDKMRVECLGGPMFPLISVKILDDLKVDPANDKEKEITVRGEILIRNIKKEFPITLKIEKELKENGEILKLVGKAQLSLKELSIPDPSIWIARVHDEVEIDFQLHLKNI
jgi:hypothetical protein